MGKFKRWFVKVRWCLSFKLCLLPEYFFVEDVISISEETREAIMKEVYNVSMEDRTLGRLLMLNIVLTNFSWKLDFEKHYAVYTLYLLPEQVGTNMITTTNINTIHNALNNHYKLKRVSTFIEHFTKLCHYLVEKGEGGANWGLLKKTSFQKGT